MNIPQGRSTGQRVASVVAIACLMLPLLTANVGAQSRTGGGPSLGDISVRDELIAAQESLLNSYRCRFDVDTHIVPGGCANGAPSLGHTQPGAFSGTPTAADLASRDNLIENQEALLNAYRCRFDVDTQIVPYDCASGRLLTRLDRLRAQLEALTIDAMNEIRSPATSLPVLRSSKELSAIAQTHAQAMADAQSFQAPFDYWAHLEPDWDFWSIGKSASITGDIYDPQAPAELSTALLGEEGSRLPACGVCTHLATGIATAADGTSYVTVMMAGRDSGRQLTEAEMAAAEAEMGLYAAKLGRRVLIFVTG